MNVVHTVIMTSKMNVSIVIRKWSIEFMALD